MQGKLSSRSNSIWSINKSNQIVQELQPSGHLNLMIKHLVEYQWARSMLGQLDQSTEQTICNIHTNIITRQTNPLCTEAFNENSNSKKPRNYVARATINLTSPLYCCVHTCLELCHDMYIPGTYIKCTKLYVFARILENQKVTLLENRT